MLFMTVAEVAKMLTLMASAWPTFEPSDDKVRLWHELFCDIPYKVAMTAVKKLMLSSKFPPTIAELRKEVLAVTIPAEDRITPAEAWGMVVHAIRDYGSYREVDALASLPEVVARVVRYIGWRELCLCDEPDIIRAQFMRMFDQVAAKERDRKLLPSGLQEQISKLSAGKDLRLIKGGKEETQ
jgi:hypothetical protein